MTTRTSFPMMLGSVFVRLFIASLASVASIVVGVVAAYLGGSGAGVGGPLALASCLIFFCFGWAALPAVRYSRWLAGIVLTAWICLAGCLFQFVAPGVQDWLLGAWFFASCGLAKCLRATPTDSLAADNGSGDAEGKV
jgi:hypothetical protein